MFEVRAESKVVLPVRVGPELFLASAISWMLFFPVGTYGNFGSYLNVFFVTVLLVLKYGIAWRTQWAVPLILMVALLVLEIFSFGLSWQTREYVFPLAWLILLVRLPVLDGVTVVRLFVFLCGAVILLDFFVLYLGFFPEFGKDVRKIVYIRGLRVYIEHFWRHIGILGNPNQSAFLYGIYLVTVAFLLSRSAGALNWGEKYFIVAVGPIAAFLLTVTYSRTNFIAAALVVIYSSLERTRGRWRYLVLVGSGTVLLFWIGGFERIAGRFSTLSSGEKRLEHWDWLLAGVSFDDVIVGAPLAARFTDSDYLFFFLRYGLIGLVLVLWVISSLYIRTRMKGLVGDLFVQLLVYALISGIAMGVFVAPNIGAFVFYMGAVVLASFDRAGDLERISACRCAGSVDAGGGG